MKDVERLTQRERQVLDLLREGFSYKEMAEILDIAASTARLHGSRAMRKAKARRLQMIARTIRQM